MSRINSTLHAVIDYGLVVLLWSAPVIFFLPANAAMVAYVLGAIHLLLSLSTNYELGIFKLIPFPIHGSIEVMTAVVMLILAFSMGSDNGHISQWFFGVLAGLIFIFWLASDYRVRRRNSY